jgi:hypothetical protein
MNLLQDLACQLRDSQERIELEKQHPGMNIMGGYGGFVIIPKPLSKEEWQRKAREVRVREAEIETKKGKGEEFPKSDHKDTQGPRAFNSSETAFS